MLRVLRKANQDLLQHLHVVALLLVLIASIVLICKSLWIKASAKWLNVNVTISLIDQPFNFLKSCIYGLLPLFDWTVGSRQEHIGWREGGGIKAPPDGNQTRVAASTVALYVGTLTTRLSVPKHHLFFISIHWCLKTFVARLQETWVVLRRRNALMSLMVGQKRDLSIFTEPEIFLPVLQLQTWAVVDGQAGESATLLFLPVPTLRHCEREALHVSVLVH